MKIGIYPGSFDPITFGHIDIIERASKIVDEVVVAVLRNSNKNPLFVAEERMDMIKESTKHLSNIKVLAFDGLLVDLAKELNAQIVIRGLRAISDYEYEIQLAQTNKAIYEKIDTIFLTTSIKYSYLSSSMVKEIASFGGDIRKFVSPYVAGKLEKKYEKFNNLKIL